MKNLIVSLILLLSCVFSYQAHANTVVINPNDDGEIYSNGFVLNYTYFMAADSIRAVAEFSMSGLERAFITAVTLSVTPKALPLWDKTIDVYAYGSNDGILTSDDYNAGTYLGVWNLPDLKFNETAYFNATAFVKSVDTPYVGFNLRTDTGVDCFTSLEYNHGAPSQLTVTTVTPEPASMILFGLGGGAMAFLRRKQLFKKS